jgi:hypothetical protein
VDDGYGVEGAFVHTRRPVPDGYVYQPPGSPAMEPRSRCPRIPVK